MSLSHWTTQRIESPAHWRPLNRSRAVYKNTKFTGYFDLKYHCWNMQLWVNSSWRLVFSVLVNVLKKKVSFCCAYLKWMEEPEFCFCGLNLYFFPGDKLFVTLKSNSLLDAFLERIPTANFPKDHYYHRELTKSVSLFIYVYICTGHFYDVFTYLFMKLCLKIFREKKVGFFLFLKYYAMKII